MPSRPLPNNRLRVFFLIDSLTTTVLVSVFVITVGLHVGHVGHGFFGAGFGLGFGLGVGTGVVHAGQTPITTGPAGVVGIVVP